MVERTADPSPFTADPRQHRITEAILPMFLNRRLTHLLPDRQTALVLADSFSVNVCVPIVRNMTYIDSRLDTSYY